MSEFFRFINGNFGAAIVSTALSLLILWACIRSSRRSG